MALNLLVNGPDRFSTIGVAFIGVTGVTVSAVFVIAGTAEPSGYKVTRTRAVSPAANKLRFFSLTWKSKRR